MATFICYFLLILADYFIHGEISIDHAVASAIGVFVGWIIFTVGEYVIRKKRGVE